MRDETFHSVLRRKAGAGRARLRIATLTPEKAMVQALSKAAQDLMNLALKVDENAAALLSLAELPEHLPDRALLALLSGPEDGLGLVALDPDLMAGLIEMQMIGRIGSAPVQPRRATRTDAAMCSPFIDRFLAQLQAELGGEAGDNWAAGYRYSSALDDPRPLGLLLEDQSYRCFRLTVELGTGTTRRGSLFLALPGNEALARDEAADPAEAARWEQALGQSVSDAPASLGTILHRLVLPLGKALTLAPGVELVLPRSALQSVDLCDGGGHILARARLGQHDGNRALCLLTPDLPLEQLGEPGAVTDMTAPPGSALSTVALPVSAGHQIEEPAGARGMAVGF